MKTIKTFLTIIIVIFVSTGCEKEAPYIDTGISGGTNELNYKGKSVPKATGSVEFAWKGGQKGGEMGNKPENLLAFFEFNAHESYNNSEAKGEIIYTVTKMDTTLHREIRAKVFDVLVDQAGNKAWFIGEVISDTKGCGGNGSGGHETGCSDSDHTDEGGCSDSDHTDEGGCGDDTSHDGGCSHETDEGGSTGHETDEGGCSDSDHTDEGGCSGETSDDGHTDGMGGSPGGEGGQGGSDKGNPLSGKNCRIGQLIVVKVHDVATPGADGDGLTWKWFSPTGSFVPATENIPEWPHLCKKTIIAGNLVVH